MFRSSKPLEITSSNSLATRLLEQAIEVYSRARVRFDGGKIRVTVPDLNMFLNAYERKLVWIEKARVLVESGQGKIVPHAIEAKVLLVKVAPNEPWFPASPLEFTVDGTGYIAHWEHYDQKAFSSEVAVFVQKPLGPDRPHCKVGHDRTDSRDVPYIDQKS